MSSQEREGWTIVAGLFIALMLVFGPGYYTAGVFFGPLLKHFGWSRAQVSTLPALLSASAGMTGALLIGWLLDRLETRVVMATGAIVVGASFLMASRANSYSTMLIAYILLGVGISATTFLPASMVVANCFVARRGLAMGITMNGATAGGMVMTLVANHAIAHGGWRYGYEVLAAPVFVIVAPMVWMLVRTRPADAPRTSVCLPGLEVGPALRTRSFWMVALANLCFGFTSAGLLIHFIAYLIGVGYRPSSAALVMRMLLACSMCGKIAMGLLADRIGGRIALGVDFVIGATGMILIFEAGRIGKLACFVIAYGFSVGVPLALLPLVTVESLGLKRFGTLSGLANIAQTVGAMLGPVIAGRVFDVTPQLHRGV
jgi:MFS family permease